jgi:hypothetical protein
MHLFSSPALLQFLVGEELGQVCLDPFSLQFHFDSRRHITVEGRIEHVDEVGVVHTHDCQVRNGAPIYLHQLLQHKVASIDVQPLCLSLIFDSGAILRIFTDEGQYECGQIYQADMKDGLIVF